MSAKDIAHLEEAGPGARYPTNTGISLTPFEILRLGAAKYDFGCVLDTESGRPLHLGRTARSASLNQRLALIASELVCSGRGCDEPIINSDVHHIESWIDGGSTDIENTTINCFKHHPNNRDQRDGFGNKGFADHDPTTGRVGFRPPKPDGTPGGEVIVNESAAQQQSGGAKIRNQLWPDEDPPPDGALF